MPKMSLVTRARKAFDILARGYDGAGESRYRTHQAYNRAPIGDEDSVIGAYDRSKLRLEARDMFRNHALVHGAVDRISSYAIGNGLWPQAMSTDENWNNEAEAFWKQIFVPTCDYRQHQGVTFVSFQKMTVSERLLSGEVGYILLTNGQIQPIEAERIATPNDYKKDPNVIEGIRRSPGGIVVGYYVLPRKNGNGALDYTKYKYVKRENFIHCWEETRPDMLHGIPDLAPIINKLRDYDTTDENVLAKIKADSMTWLLRKRASGGVANDRNRDSYQIEQSTDTNPQRVEKIEGLRMINLKTNEDYQPFESKTPNQHYVPYMEHELRVISQCFNLPYEFLMLIFTAGSYSAQRAAMLHAHSTIMDWVDWVNRVLNSRVWNWRIAKAIKHKEIAPAPLDENGVSQWWRVDWSLPPWREIDADKQAKGDLAFFKMGRRSLKSMIRSEGRDRDDVLREKAEDLKRAKEIAAEYGVDPDKLIETGATQSAPMPGE